VHTNQSFPGKKEDFPSVQAYENWQKKEVKQLTELMKSLMLMNPNLSIATSSEQDVGSTNLLARQSTDSYASISNSSTSSISVGDTVSMIVVATNLYPVGGHWLLYIYSIRPQRMLSILDEHVS